MSFTLAVSSASSPSPVSVLPHFTLANCASFFSFSSCSFWYSSLARPFGIHPWQEGLLSQASALMPLSTPPCCCLVPRHRCTSSPCFLSPLLPFRQPLHFLLFPRLFLPCIPVLSGSRRHHHLVYVKPDNFIILSPRCLTLRRYPPASF